MGCFGASRKRVPKALSYYLVKRVLKNPQIVIARQSNGKTPKQRFRTEFHYRESSVLDQSNRSCFLSRIQPVFRGDSGKGKKSDIKNPILDTRQYNVEERRADNRERDACHV